MIVEINLLGKREKRNLAPLLIFAILAALLLSLSVVAFMLNQATNSELTRLEQKLQTTKQLNEVYEQQSGEVQTTNAVDDLKVTINWVETFPTPTVLLIRHLTSLLPERGFIMNFSYSDDGSLSLVVQTDTNREMAYYLKSLLESPFLTEASLNSMTTNPVTPTNHAISDEIDEENYIPRYTGQFQLKVNKAALKAEVELEGTE